MSNPGFSIGPVAVPGTVVLAPMSGITDVTFRQIARTFGAPLVVSEMVASDAFVKGAEEARLRAESDGAGTHVVQIAGCDPAWMSEAARLAEANGAAIIDINMGCPAKRVTGGQHAGSALMRDLDHAVRLIDATVAAVSVPVTVKMRLGWDDASLNAADLARRAEALGVAAVTVHGRTRCQFYNGQANWGAVRAVTAAVGIPVVCNGDGATLPNAHAMLEASGARAVMIGRAAVGQPWLVGQIAAGLATGRFGDVPSRNQRREAVLFHLDGLQARLGARSGLRHARKHLAAYADSDGFAGSEAERRQLVTSEDGREVRSLVLRMFAGKQPAEAA